MITERKKAYDRPDIDTEKKYDSLIYAFRQKYTEKEA